MAQRAESSGSQALPPKGYNTNVNSTKQSSSNARAAFQEFKAEHSDGKSSKFQNPYVYKNMASKNLRESLEAKV